VHYLRITGNLFFFLPSKRERIYFLLRQSKVAFLLNQEKNTSGDDPYVHWVELAERCNSGDRDAQKKVFILLSPAMKAICARYASGPDQAKDFLQEGFIRFFDKLHLYRGDASLETWATRLFMNNCVSLLLKEKKHRFWEELKDSQDVSGEDVWVDREIKVEAEKVMELLQQLPHGYRTVLNLYVFEDLSHKEISVLLGITESTSKSQLFKARKALRHLLESWKNG
jgi:RNA polymerase sigma-70 factor (ECF subfamily)